MRKTAFVMMVALMTGLVCVSGCGDGDTTGGCKSHQQPGITLSVNPSSVPANGATSITATVLVLDENCDPYPIGTMVEFTLIDQTPAEAGQFSNGQSGMSVAMGAGGFVVAGVVSTVQGTASINATAVGTSLNATPVAVQFTGLVQNLCTIEVTVDPLTISGDGSSTSTITATVVNFSGDPVSDGTQVNFSTTEGNFVDSSEATTSALTSGGEAQVSLRSDVVTENVTAEVTAGFTCNDSLQTQYSDQANVRFTPGVATDEPFIILAAEKDRVLADGESIIVLTATVFGSNGSEVGAGVDVTFTIDQTHPGTFEGTGTKTETAQTNSSGQATVNFIGGVTGGMATVTAAANVESTDITDQLTLNVVQIGYVEYIGADFTKLGIRGSGRNETSSVTFRVRDTEGNPLPNLLVTFSISMAPGVVLEPYQTSTDTEGLAKTIIMSGIHATTVTITARATVGQVTLQATSPAFAIVGAKPNARYLTFACERNNVDGFIWVNATTECIVMLADRFSNKIGFATEVAFMTEAGHITPSVMTGVDGDEMGLATTATRTGMPLPADVEPLAGENSYNIDIEGNTITRNPRDGLVTMIAYTTGEEDFTDINENGVYDPPALPDFAGEPFVDLGEPFVDINDNGEHDPEESLFVDVNGDDEYDGPNGVWDENTVIWIPVWMAWSGHVLLSATNINPCNGFQVTYGGSTTFTWEAMDINLNPLNHSGDYSVAVEGKGKLAGSQPIMPLSDMDWLGTEIFMFKVNDRETLTRCQEFDSDPDPLVDDRDITCYWMPVITGFSYGIGGTFVIRGADADPDNPEPPGAGTITLKVEYNDSSGKTYSNGIVCEGQFVMP